ncbi:unnamed protein product [Tenebrio molitor]|nr:unnamed protein product [Tenebrio molitor]
MTKIQYTTIKIPFSRLKPRAYKKKISPSYFRRNVTFTKTQLSLEPYTLRKFASTVKVFFSGRIRGCKKIRFFFEKI